MPASGAAAAELDRLADAVERLRAGGLVVAATETLLGVLADARSLPALARLARLKSRPPDQPFPLILPGPEAVAALAAEFPPAARRAAAAFWPGPLTLLLPARSGLSSAIVGPDGAVALRVPAPSPAARLCRAFGGPLAATSANRRGFPCPADTADLDPELRAAVDLVLPGRAPGDRPSTLVAFGSDGRYRVVREGAVGAAALSSALS